MKKSMSFSSLSNGWLIALLVLATCLAYGRFLDNQFIWDDYLVLKKNSFVHSWKNFPKLFSPEYITSPSQVYDVGKKDIGAGELTYRPVSTLTYFIEFSFWQKNPLGYHLTNLFLHILNVLLVFWFVRLLSKERMISFVAALIFALHPVGSEVVYNISFREDLLACFFCLLSFIFYIRLDLKEGLKKTFFYSLSVLFYFLGIFSKEMAITLPILLVVHDIYIALPGGRTQLFQRIKSRYFGYILVTLFYLWVWFFPMARHPEEMITYPCESLFLNILTMIKVFANYVYWLFLPFTVHATIPDGAYFVRTVFAWDVLLSFLVIILSLIYAVQTFKTNRTICFGLTWFFIVLLPVSNILPIQNIIAARYLYLPMVGFCLVISYFFFGILLKSQFLGRSIYKTTIKSSLIGLMVCYVLLTFARGYTWRNDITLWKEIVRFYPQSIRAHKSLAFIYANEGFKDKAIQEYSQAKKLNPNDVEARYALGQLFLFQGILDKAQEEFQAVIERDKKMDIAYNNYCMALYYNQRQDESITCFLKMIEEHPGSAKPYENLGMIYEKMGKAQEARKMRDKARQIEENN
ncbi:MAG: tetratricopeptide repeat protein [Candidatus Omnitrophota bacterium]